MNLAHPPMSSWSGASSSLQSGCRRKTCVLSPLPKLSNCSVVAKCPSARTVKHKVIEETPVSLMASKLWSRFVASGPRGTMSDDYVSIPLAFRSEFRDLMIHRWSRFSLGRLRAATNVEDRWLVGRAKTCGGQSEASDHGNDAEKSVRVGHGRFWSGVFAPLLGTALWIRFQNILRLRCTVAES